MILSGKSNPNIRNYYVRLLKTYYDYLRKDNE
jgi:hypothetical protein